MTVTIGQRAPDFSLETNEGTVTLDSFAGKRLVLYFYPKDDTPGCTTQAQQFRDDAPRYAIAKAEVLGVSKDSLASHAKFKAKHTLPFALGSDAEGKACEAYEVWKEKSNYGKKYMGIERSTFLIDENGIVVAAWRKVKVGGHSAEILAKLHELG